MGEKGGGGIAVAVLHFGFCFVLFCVFFCEPFAQAGGAESICIAFQKRHLGNAFCAFASASASPSCFFLFDSCHISCTITRGEHESLFHIFATSLC